MQAESIAITRVLDIIKLLNRTIGVKMSKDKEPGDNEYYNDDDNLPDDEDSNSNIEIPEPMMRYLDLLFSGESESADGENKVADETHIIELKKNIIDLAGESALASSWPSLLLQPGESSVGNAARDDIRQQVWQLIVEKCGKSRMLVSQALNINSITISEIIEISEEQLQQIVDLFDV